MKKMITGLMLMFSIGCSEKSLEPTDDKTTNLILEANFTSVTASDEIKVTQLSYEGYMLTPSSVFKPLSNGIFKFNYNVKLVKSILKLEVKNADGNWQTVEQITFVQ